MSGVKYLLDTNVILALLKGQPALVDILDDPLAELCCLGYSTITRIELLGFPAITREETDAIKSLLAEMQCFYLTQEVEDETIRLRKEYKIKLPDALILATANVNGLLLQTLDQDLKTLRKLSQSLINT